MGIMWGVLLRAAYGFNEKWKSVHLGVVLLGIVCWEEYGAAGELGFRVPQTLTAL